MGNLGRPVKFEIDSLRQEEEFPSPEEYFTSIRAVEYTHSGAMRKTAKEDGRWALELIEIDPDGLVLDLGAGPGSGKNSLPKLGST